jgi:hypothetical protein
VILKRIAAVSLSSATLLGAGSGVAQADNDVNFMNNSQVLNCFSLRIADVPVLSTSNDNIDCSVNMQPVEPSPGAGTNTAPMR